MTNREWLNTLSDEEWIGKASDLIDRCIFCEIGDVRNCHESDSECLKRQLAWLSQPHETTADEDFAEIGFRPHNAGVTKAYWFQRESRDYVSIYETTIGYDGIFTDEEIDQIRKIADKKRKEVWG